MHSITISMPVRNLRVSMAFFSQLGLAFGPEPSGPDSACLMIDENVQVLLVEHGRYRDHVNGEISQEGCVGEVLISLPATTERQVDEIVMRAIMAGAQPWPVVDERPVYSGSFRDPDGHLWQVACPRQPTRQHPAMASPPAADPTVVRARVPAQPGPAVARAWVPAQP